MKKIELKNNWKFKITSSSNSFAKFKSWMDCDVPGTVHTDLLNLGLIEDPYFEDNEKRLQWVSEQDWVYKTSFDLPNNFNTDNPINLVFEGVDTTAEAWLNKKPIGNFQNMFRKYEFEVSKILKKKNNILEIKFQSAINYAMEQEKKYGQQHKNINSDRVYIRKAQYSFGWDWGPSFPTMGLWKPVYIEQQSVAHIKNISFSTLEIKKGKAIVEVTINLSGTEIGDMSLDIFLKKDNQSTNKSKTKLSYKNKLKFEISDPQLWWPNCAGDQPLYDLRVKLKDLNKRLLDKVEKKVGIRTIELLLEESGKNTFKILVNYKEIFIKGVNWIPTDSFLPRISEEKYTQLLSLAKEANCNMIRIWGGGIYEQDILYELCDELGLLVWQDFMFACGLYPEHDEFIENVKVEIKQNVERLQHHPSLALWCGNNECEWLWYQNRDKDITKLPGHNIYHNLIPNLLKEVDPMRPYWPSSPFGYDEDPNDEKSGNTHQWNIWSNWIDYTKVIKDNSLFVSEFGFQAPANETTWKAALSKENHRCDNPMFEFHNKQIEGQKRIFQFLSDHLPMTCDWNDFIYLAQLNQGLALKNCIEHWRANWPRTNGTIIWQLNDCWPAISWSIIDSDLIPKLSYYFVKDVYSDQILTIIKENLTININFNNHSKTKTICGLLKLHIIEQQSGKAIKEYDKQFSIQNCRNNIIYKVPIQELRNSGDNILIASVYNENDKLLHRNFYLEQEWKNVNLPETKLEIEFTEKSDLYISIKSNTPIFFVDLYHPHIKFDARGFILLPGETKKIKVYGDSKGNVKADELQVYSLNKYLSS